MSNVPCFADCVHAHQGDCRLEVIGSDRLSEMECACEFYRPRKSSSDLIKEM